MPTDNYKQDCALCSFTYLHSELRKNYRGFWVCPKDWEPKPGGEYPPRRNTNEGKPPRVIYQATRTATTTVINQFGAVAGGSSVPTTWEGNTNTWEAETRTWESLT